MKIIGSSQAVRSPEFHRRKQKEKVLKILALVAFVLVAFVVPVFVLRSEKLQISGVEVSGNNVTGEDEIERVLDANLSGKYLWFIPKSSALLLQRGKLERDLMSSIPRLSYASVSLADTQTLSVSVSERKPFALYCEDISDLDNPSHCYFVDGAGYIFSEAPGFSGGVYMIYGAEPLIESPLGKRYLSEERFRSLSRFVRDLPILGVSPRAVVHEDGEYTTVLQGGPELKVRADQDMESVAVNLESFLRGSKLTASEINKLQYIDLRFENKVFYK